MAGDGAQQRQGRALMPLGRMIGARCDGVAHPLHPHARIEIAIEDVDQQIDQQYIQRDDDEGRLHDRKILLENGFDAHAAKSGYGEDHFDKKGPREHATPRQPDDGDDRDHPRLEACLATTARSDRPLARAVRI